ncbi:MAG: hypothetical protein HW387_1369 [Parachlamydiales bacterium]|nr:hypothetical protein [Parachlamydiales bacterium]
MTQEIRLSSNENLLQCLHGDDDQMVPLMGLVKRTPMGCSLSSEKGLHQKGQEINGKIDRMREQNQLGYDVEKASHDAKLHVDLARRTWKPASKTDASNMRQRIWDAFKKPVLWVNEALRKKKETFFVGPSRPYLQTVDQLEKNAIARLGSMDSASYDDFVKKMHEVAAKKGIDRPTLAIGIIFKEGAHPFLKEIPYPVLKEEWSEFKDDCETMCEKMPEVFVVDGNKFALPI